ENPDTEKSAPKANESNNQNAQKSTMEQNSFNNFKKNLNAEINYDKHKSLTDKGQSFDVNLYTRKSIITPANRLIMNMVFSEELDLIIISLDNMDVMFYNLVSCEHILTRSFGNPLSNDKEISIIPTLALEQEFLYYCDDKKIIIYDLVLNEEIINYQHLLS